MRKRGGGHDNVVKSDPVKFFLLLSLAVLCLFALASPAFAAVVPRTQSSDGAVDVLFTVYGGNTHYKIYRHQRSATNPEYSDPDADYNVAFAEVGSVQVSLTGGDLNTIVGSSTIDGDDSFTTVKPGLKYVVFRDRGDIVNWREYYYLITEGTSYQSLPNSWKPEDYVITAAFPPNQTRHGNYTEFTGACTGCHGLHSAQSKQKLLKGATVSDLCATCHDGSVSKYDVVKGKVMMEGNMYAPQPAGPFGTQLLDNVTDGDDTALYRWASSVHNIYRSNTAVVWAQVYLAPGTGFRPGNAPDSAKGSYGSTTDFSPVGWGSQLSCISCHEPHNKPLNFRLLRNDITDGATGDGDTGIKVRGLSETGIAEAGDVMWPQTYTDHGSNVGSYVYVSQTKFLSGTSRFCSQCHRAFFNKSIRVVDNRVLTVMFTKPGEGGYSSTEQENIRDFFLGLSALYATEVPTESAVQTYVTANIGKMNEDPGPGRNCDLCHGIEAETKEADGSASSVEVIESTASKTIYIGWATGDRNLDRDAGADADGSVMGSGHRHPTEVPAQRVRISSKVINRETLNTMDENQAWIRPGPVNVGVPLEGTGSGVGTSSIDSGYPTNNVVCLTCHMAHGSRADVVGIPPSPWSDWTVGSKLEVAYDNFSVNNPGQTVGPGGIEQNPVSGYYRDTSTVPASGVNTVLARFAPMGRACFYCHSTRL